MAVRLLAALAHESRLEAFRALVIAGPGGLCVGDLQAALGIPMTTLSFHLKELTRAGLLTSRQEGRFIYYAPAFAVMGGLLGFLTDKCCAGLAPGKVSPASRAAGKACRC